MSFGAAMKIEWTYNASIERSHRGNGGRAQSGDQPDRDAIDQMLHRVRGMRV